MKSIKTLFHGSPHNIKDKILPSEPRGSDPFQTQKAVFATDIEKVAQIYAITRDKQRKRRGWFIFKNELHILKPYNLNKVGYVYVFSTRNYLEDPENNPNQFAIKRKISPEYKYLVKLDDIKDNIIEYDTKEKFVKGMKKLILEK
tara:strand:+ start:38 stop:472 length:435 start_codon:yes stop_codon:yes gene_type:complete